MANGSTWAGWSLLVAGALSSGAAMGCVAMPAEPGDEDLLRADDEQLKAPATAAQLVTQCGTAIPPGYTVVYDRNLKHPDGGCYNAATSYTTIKINPDCSGDDDACYTLRHETCHARQYNRIADDCGRLYPVLRDAARYLRCLEDTAAACIHGMEAECYRYSLPPTDQRVAEACMVFGPSQLSLCAGYLENGNPCACGSLGAAYCSAGQCPSGQMCQSANGRCGCVTAPPPPRDAGTDGGDGGDGGDAGRRR